MQADPAEIARRLTKAQKTALMWYPVRGGWTSHAAEHLRRRHASLQKLGLTDERPGDAGLTVRWLTPLGLLVRAELERPEAKDG